tara:strand:- start:2135 stop:3319 length:1185 start_codon:yes stop_codon:yes gene_type:complete
MGILIPLFLIILSCLIIWRACYGFETSSQYLGRYLSDGVRGATINAISSSVPELFTTIFFLLYLKDTEGFSGGIGTTAGSAIFNGMIIPALVILTVIYFRNKKNISISKRVILRDGIALIIAELILIFVISGNALYWWHGAVLMLTYLVYLFYMFYRMEKVKKEDIDYSQFENENENRIQENKSLIQSIVTIDLENIVLGTNRINKENSSVLLLLSTAIIGLSCLILVSACEMIGNDLYYLPYIGEVYGLDIPILFIAVILASAATSVPDTVISIRDAKIGNYNDAIANALGSNIFDICFALGLPLFFYCIFYGPIYMDPETIKFSSELRILLLIFTVFSFLIFYIGKSMGKIKAYLLLTLYLLFTIYIISISIGLSWAQSISEFLEKIYLFIN